MWEGAVLPVLVLHLQKPPPTRSPMKRQTTRGLWIRWKTRSSMMSFQLAPIHLQNVKCISAMRVSRPTSTLAHWKATGPIAGKYLFYPTYSSLWTNSPTVGIHYAPIHLQDVICISAMRVARLTSTLAHCEDTPRTSAKKYLLSSAFSAAIELTNALE